MSIKNDPEYMAKATWSILRLAIQAHNNQGIKVEDVQMDMHSRDIFPTVTFRDEQANRFGAVFADLRRFLGAEFDMVIYSDYEPRTEFQHFPQVKDIFMYFYGKLSGLDQELDEIDFE